MVAPSLEIVTDRPLETSLSMPRGPRVVRTASEMAWHAFMLEISWAFPCERELMSFANQTQPIELAGNASDAPEKYQFPL